MKKVIEMLKGKKTYIVAFLVAVVTFAQVLGWVDAGTAGVMYGLLGASGLASLRASVSKD